MHPADEPIAPREIWPPGTLIKGDYVIEKRLGAGGFGTVYLAHNRFMGSPCVIKRLHEHYASDAEYVRKFVNEGRAIRRLRACPHIVEVEQMTQTEDNHLILVMEYIPGGDLAALMQSRVLSPGEVIEYGRQIAVGLHAAHLAGLVHRDIKPQNVLVGQDPVAGRTQLKLIDFGIAADHSSNQQTSIMRGGSIGYAAPEQWAKAGKDLDGRTDLYALGATLYRMLTGQMPYPEAADVGAFFARSIQGPPKPAHLVRGDVPVELSRLIQDLLSVQVEARPADAGQVISRLEAMQSPQASPAPAMHPQTLRQTEPVHQDFKPPPAPSPPPPSPPPPFLAPPSAAATKRNGWLIASIAAGLLAVGFGGWRFFRTPSSEARGTATLLTVAGTPKVNPTDGLKYAPIPAGTFRMGCSVGDKECSVDETAHEVQITKPFWIGQTEVTQAAYARLTGVRPGMYKGDDLPVEQVNVAEAQNYCRAAGGRLPTEAEWEYAARGGNQAARYGNLDDVAWYTGNSGKKNHPVGLKTANGFGLFDVLGNVWEWTADRYDKDYYVRGERRDPQGPAGGDQQVLRGGNWDYRAAVVRVSYRGKVDPAYRSFGIGFRCVLDQGAL